MAKSPTQRTMSALKADENIVMCAIVEKWNAFARRPGGGKGVRQDMFGIIDIVACDWSRGVVGVQSTGTGFAEHDKAFFNDPAKRKASINWLRTPGSVLELWGWRKLKARKKDGSYAKNTVWTSRVKVYTLADFEEGDDDEIFDL